jgi:hypothetical protein
MRQQAPAGLISLPAPHGGGRPHIGDNGHVASRRHVTRNIGNRVRGRFRTPEPNRTAHRIRRSAKPPVIILRWIWVEQPTRGVDGETDYDNNVFDPGDCDDRDDAM